MAAVNLTSSIEFKNVIAKKLRKDDIPSKALRGLSALRAVWVSTTAATYSVPLSSLTRIVKVQKGRSKEELGTITLYVRRGMSLANTSIKTGVTVGDSAYTSYSAKVRREGSHKLITAKRSGRSALMRTAARARTIRRRESVKGFMVRGHKDVFIRKQSATWQGRVRTPIIKMFRIPDAYLLNGKRVQDKVKLKAHLRRMSSNL